VTIDLGEINYLAVGVAVIVSMATGALWYSPILWAKPWTALVKLPEELLRRRDLQMKGYVTAIVASIIIALGLAVVVQATGADTLAEGLFVGLIAGVGFAATAMAANYAFSYRPLKLYLIDAGDPVVAMAIMGAVLGLWR
jgi:hypothetical protein